MGGEDGIVSSVCFGFLDRLAFGDLRDEEVRLRFTLESLIGVGGPGAGGGGIGAANGAGREGVPTCCWGMSKGCCCWAHWRFRSCWWGLVWGSKMEEKSWSWRGTSNSVHSWSVKGAKEEAGGVSCCWCMRGARRRRVGRVGEDWGGRAGDEGAGRGLCRECCCSA
jgi:hypothetical protein